MLKWIGLIALFVCLAKYPAEVKQGIDVGSYVAKVVWVLSEKTFKTVNELYAKDVAPEVEKAKSLDVSAPVP